MPNKGTDSCPSEKYSSKWNRAQLQQQMKLTKTVVILELYIDLCFITQRKENRKKVEKRK
jgi:hypothetical protein